MAVVDIQPTSFACPLFTADFANPSLLLEHLEVILVLHAMLDNPSAVAISLEICGSFWLWVALPGKYNISISINPWIARIAIISYDFTNWTLVDIFLQ